ncbi:hypothetical protein EMIHUDRAFT_450464, partial [Emiliania huxleyi CCMP1516]
GAISGRVCRLGGLHDALRAAGGVHGPAPQGGVPRAGAVLWRHRAGGCDAARRGARATRRFEGARATRRLVRPAAGRARAVERDVCARREEGEARTSQLPGREQTPLAEDFDRRPPERRAHRAARDGRPRRHSYEGGAQLCLARLPSRPVPEARVDGVPPGRRGRARPLLHRRRHRAALARRHARRQQHPSHVQHGLARVPHRLRQDGRRELDLAAAALHLGRRVRPLLRLHRGVHQGGHHAAPPRRARVHLLVRALHRRRPVVLQPELR